MRFKSQIRNVNTFASIAVTGLVDSHADTSQNFVPLWPRSVKSRGAVSQMKKFASLSFPKRAAKSGRC